MKRNKMVAVSGAAVGIALFLAFGLLPAVLYGGYAGLLLATGIFGAPLPQHLFARGLVAFGSLLGVLGTAAVFAVIGAAAASALGHIVASVSPAPREKLAQAEPKSR
jgi:hypothetical protein